MEALPNQHSPQNYRYLATKLSKVDEAIRHAAQTGQFGPSFDTISEQLAKIEVISRGLENYRLASLARATRLMVQKVRLMDSPPQPSTVAFSLFAIAALSRLVEMPTRYQELVEYDGSHSSAEAIRAIIDHTDELSAPHMRPQ